MTFHDHIWEHMRKHQLTMRQMDIAVGCRLGGVLKVLSGVENYAIYKQISAHLGIDNPLPPPPSKANKLPDWIKSAPASIRDLLEQEYLVDPQRAKEFAKCKTVDDVHELRRKSYRLESTISASSLIEPTEVVR